MVVLKYVYDVCASIINYDVYDVLIVVTCLIVVVYDVYDMMCVCKYYLTQTCVDNILML